MGLFDNVDDKAKDALSNPDNKAKIQQIAQEKGISTEEAKDHLLKHNEQ